MNSQTFIPLIDLEPKKEKCQRHGIFQSEAFLEQELRIYLCHESTVSQDNSALGGTLGRL